jgi:hypothetical protein
MKKSILTAALLFGLGTFFMTSCGPDDGGTTTTPTPTKTVDKTKLVNGMFKDKKTIVTYSILTVNTIIVEAGSG